MDSKRKCRRKSKRYPAKGCFVSGFSNYKTIEGEIINISEGGLAFSFIDTGEEINDSFELTIVHKGRELRLKDVPARAVSDFKIEKEIPYNYISMRQCCVEFENLNEEHRAQIDRFLSQFSEK